MNQNTNIFNYYCREALKYPLLSVEEEKHLFNEYGRASLKEKDKLRDKIFNCNLRLVLSIARKYQNSGLDLMDLIQEGNIGLLKAIDKYTVDKDTKFSTYATYWIRQSITRAIVNSGRSIRLPAHVQTTLNKINQKEHELTQKLNREPDEFELAMAMDMSVCKLNEYLSYSLTDTKSLDDKIDDERVLGDIVSDNDSINPLDAMVEGDRNQILVDALEQLSTRERDIIIKHFGLFDTPRYSLEEIGKFHNLTRERIRQIQTKSLKTLRKTILQLDPSFVI